MNNKGYVLFVALIAIIILLVLSFYPTRISDEDKAISYPVFPCNDLISGCKVEFSDITVEIQFPENIVFLKKFPIELRVSNESIDKVTVDFKMVDMNMGLNFYQLQQNNNDKSLWTGQGVLPVCTTGRTDWQATVSLHTGTQVKYVAFQFEVNASAQ